MSDLRVALRIQATSGNSRREVQALEQSLKKTARDGAKALGDEANRTGAALSKSAQTGATSYKIVRQAMRETAQGQGVFRQGVTQTSAELKNMGQVGRQAARETKGELAKAAKDGADQLRKSVDKTEVSMRRLAQSGGSNLRLLKRLAGGVRDEFNRLKGIGQTAQGKLAGLGIGVGVGAGLTGSAKLDRSLIRTQQTAGMTNAEREEWRNEGFRIAKKYGLDRTDVDSGFNTLIASGVNYGASKTTSDAIGQATAVTGADSAVLGKAVVAGASAFNLDLNKAGVALDLLQKMTVAGRQGNAELENLADLFPKIGGAAQAAGMSLAQALAFTETLSTVELQPERLGTLAESTLRVFSNKTYRDQVTKASGVKFFDAKGASRNPEDVFADLKRKYDKMQTDEQRAKFMGTVFKGMDQDTVRGMRIMLTGDKNETFKRQAKEIQGAKPIFESDLKDNVESATGAGARMKATMGEAIDRMAQPLNKGFADFGSYLLDDLNLSGEQLLAGGVAAGVGGYYAGRGAKAGAGALMNKFMGGPETLKNIAVGKVLEEATGVTSVFVTNWPSDGITASTPDLDSKSKKEVPTGLLGIASLAAIAAGISGSTENTDEGRLRAAQNSKLDDAGQKAYKTSFYKNRIELAKNNPDASSDWLSSQAQQLAREQTGLTAAGTSATGAVSWAQNAASRLTQAAVGPLQQGADNMAEQRLRSLIDKPLVVEVRVNSEMIQADVERRTELQVRRGN
ncbi:MULTISPECIES: phage tail tape measure protein [Pseudomonas]|uniref:phage tail tape measure protein n=1 Tax=Pseudomonas TaxID=286 RepID=UPI000B35F1CD|nr:MULTISPECIES: phage tail tape measure protein [Pseudomonas]PMY49105.1 phage tail protein [Pseudomonas sp. FW305-53]PMY85640.1 phage tail protein [Pseudomonas sp. FW303-C2]PMY92846.1 phage tail protein [Pseudomonas sp. FW305-62]PNA44359.1 phage tail protein [Pseudomonas sp. FW306-2-2C-A10BC]PNA83020.1 phage tail protein [Pseudomonas sp. MPR-R3B]